MMKTMTKMPTKMKMRVYVEQSLVFSLKVDSSYLGHGHHHHAGGRGGHHHCGGKHGPSGGVSIALLICLRD